MRRYRYKVVDDESGLVFYDDKATERWDGAIVSRRNDEIDHPQKYIRPTANDPTPTEIQRPPHWPVSDVIVDNTLTYNSKLFVDYRSQLEMPTKYVGNTTHLAPEGPAEHHFLAGIEYMTIGDPNPRFTFKVRDLNFVPSADTLPQVPSATSQDVSSIIGTAVIEGADYRFEVK